MKYDNDSMQCKEKWFRMLWLVCIQKLKKKNSRNSTIRLNFDYGCGNMYIYTYIQMTMWIYTWCLLYVYTLMQLIVHIYVFICRLFTFMHLLYVPVRVVVIINLLYISVIKVHTGGEVVGIQLLYNLHFSRRYTVYYGTYTILPICDVVEYLTLLWQWPEWCVDDKP